MPALNSAARGFLLPGTGVPFDWGKTPLGWGSGFWTDAGQPLAGQSLDDFLQQFVAGITGIPGNLVRPRWQPEPPNAPPITHTATPGNTPVVPCWAAVGVVRSSPLGFPANTEIATGAAASNGFSQQSDQEEFDLLCSFYGRLADNFAVALRAGLMVAQNRECLQLANIGLINTSGRTRVPTLTQGQWWMRVDITATFQREVRSFYPVLYYLSAPFRITTDTGLEVSDEASILPPSPPTPPPLPPAPAYDIPFQYLGMPQAGFPILRYTFVERFSTLQNLAGSAATVANDNVAATTVIFDIARNGTNFGTMTFVVGSMTASFLGSAQTFNPGDVLSMTPRTTDATLAFLSGNIFGKG